MKLPLLISEAPSFQTNYLQLSIAFLGLATCFEFYLEFRQRRYFKKKELPQALVDAVGALEGDLPKQSKYNLRTRTKSESKGSEEHKTETNSLLSELETKFHQSQSYNLEKNSFSFVAGVFNLTISITSLALGLLPVLWMAAKELVVVSGYTNHAEVDSHEVVVSIVFMTLSSLVDTVIQLPLSLYKTFRIEAKHGFNNSTLGLFFSDAVKNLLVGVGMSVPLVAGIIKLVHFGGPDFHLYVWGFLVCFMLVMVTVYPNVIMPLFNKFSPLEDGPLKSAIEDLASSLNFPLKKLFEVDGSKRSSHSNAYLYGFFKDKRIVLFDTLLRNPEEPKLECTTEEIVAILAHELGHWAMSHTLKGFGLQVTIYYLGLRAVGLFLNDADMYSSFGFADRPVIIAFTIFFGYIMTPLGSLLTLALNSVTRLFEFQADNYAKNLNKAAALKRGLVKISLANLGAFHVDPLYHAFHHSHPSLLERIAALDLEETDKKKTN